MKQRTDEQILEDYKKNNMRTDVGLVIELLLDIRSLLHPIKEDNSNKEKNKSEGYNTEKATDSQLAYLQKLQYEGNYDLSKKEAQQLIKEKKEQTY